MRKEYDLKRLKWKRNPYVRSSRRLVTLRLDDDVVAHFKALSVLTGIPYQRLINLYLRECAHARRGPDLRWSEAS